MGSAVRGPWFLVHGSWFLVRGLRPRTPENGRSSDAIGGGVPTPVPDGDPPNHKPGTRNVSANGASPVPDSHTLRTTN